MNNSITIGNVTIHQSDNGLYLLTDLWKSSGGNKKDQPNKWLNLIETQRYISYLGTKTENVKKSSYFLTIQGKDNQGTYVCRQLVYSFAMWISPAFHDLVIDTFDQLQNATTTQELIDLKFQLDDIQLDLSYREPRDKNTLAVHLQVATSKLKPYFDFLVQTGELTREWIAQPPKAVYHATTHSQHVIGKKGKTILFNEDVKQAFPVQTNWGNL